MAKVIQRRRGSTTEHNTFTGALAEITIDTTKDTVVVHDGSTVGGVPLSREDLSNSNMSALSTIVGSDTESTDRFLIYDVSVGAMKAITREELNNAIEADALENVAITGGTIDGTAIGGNSASSGAFTDLSYTGTLTGSTGVLNIGSGQIYKDASGNVGIGITSPSEKLEVDGNIISRIGSRIGSTESSRGFFTISTPHSNSGVVGRGVSFGNNLRLENDPSEWVQPYTNVGGGALVMTASNGSYGEFLFYAAQDQDVGTSILERMRIDTSGNVGIGTSSPDEKLHISSHTGATIRLESTKTSVESQDVIGAIEWEGNDASTGSSGIGGKIDVIAQDVSPDYAMRFFTASNAFGVYTFTEKMRITHSGNIGIGTTPNALLEIKSSSPEFRVTDGGGDYAQFRYNGGQLTITSDETGAVSGLMAFRTNATERMRIDSSGNVGIGTSSPNYKLDIEDTGDAALRIKTSDTGGGDDAILRLEIGGTTAESMIFFGDADSTFIGQIRYDHNNDSMQFATASTERLRITSTGNVGIGTTIPDAKFQVATTSTFDPNSAKATAGIFIEQSGGTQGDGNYSTAITLSKINSSRPFGSIAGVQTGTDADTGGLAFFTHGSSSSNDQVFEQLRIDSSGNVGIGTTSPNQKLDVEGTILCNTLRSEQTNVKLEIIPSDSLGVAVIGTDSEHPLALRVNNSEAMRIDSSGNVGIGTTNPNSKLQVTDGSTFSIDTINGNLRIQKVNARDILQLIDAGADSEVDAQGYIEFSRTTAIGGSLTRMGYVGFGSSNNENINVVNETTNGAVVFTAGSAEAARITSSGNVGIGVTSQQTKLEVNGDIGIGRVAGGYTFREVPGGGERAGIKSNANNELIFNVAAADEAMRIRNNGNVGIGTLSPSVSLEVANSENAVIRLTASNTDGSYVQFGDTDDGNVGEIAYFHSTNAMRFKTNDDERMRIDSSGRVGIGTSSPVGILDVVGGSSRRLVFSDAGELIIQSINGSDMLQLIDAGATTPQAANPIIEFIYANGVGASANRMGYVGYGSISDENIGIVNENASGGIEFVCGGSEAMRIDSSGNVGIGTSSPTRLIDARGAGNPEFRFSSTDSSDVAIYFGDQTDLVKGGFVFDNTDNALIFRGYNNVESARIDSSGNVGIGTSSPNRKLDVQGSQQIAATFHSTQSTATISFVNSSSSDDDDDQIGTTDGNNFFVRTNGSERLRIAPLGNVGIGTSSPVSPLHVIRGSNGNVLHLNGGSNTWDFIVKSPNADNATSILYSLGLYRDDGATDVAGINFFRGASAQDGTISFQTNALERIRINSAGNVGIGTSSPVYQLDVENTGAKHNVFRIRQNSASSTWNCDFELSTVHDTTGATLISKRSNDGSLWLYQGGANYIAMHTNATERARIDSSGNLLVGTTTGSTHRIYKDEPTREVLQVLNLNSTTGSDCLALTLSTNNDSTGTFIACNDFGASRMLVLGNGNVQNVNNSYGAISDIKLKENIVDATPKLEKLNQVRVVNYNLKDKPDQKLLGVVAQELEQIFPGMVEESPDLDKDGNDLGTTTKAVKYSVFVPMLIKAMQEQQEQINTLKAQVAALQGT